MSGIWKALNHAGMALFVFVVLTGAFLWSTGSLRIELGGVPASPAAVVHTADDGHGHAAPDEKAKGAEQAGAHSTDDGHGHAAEGGNAAGAEEPKAVAMCAEHGVPKDACTRCNPALIAAFKAKGDWCAGHNVPESQCTVCNPDLKKTPAPKAEEPKAVAMCAEHGVPKDACTRCNPALIAAFKARGDWCAGHNVPESQCTVCNPNLKKTPAPKAEEPKAVALCAEHGVPKDACTRCNPALIAAFKAKGDWCAGHNLPESQCTICNPDLKKAPAPKAEEKKAPPAPSVPSAPSIPSSPDLSALEQRTCNHGKRTVDCDSCRFELGVVKVQPSVAMALLTTAKVVRREVAAGIDLTGEVQLDQTRVVDVAPPAAGRVVQVVARLGQMVKEGDVLAVIHSGDFGEAKAKFLEAAIQLEIARKERERQSGMTAAMEKLLEKLAKNDGSAQDASGAHDAGGKPKEFVGEGRSKLVGAAARLKLAKSACDREKDLWEKQVTSRADFETARQEFEAAQAEYAAGVEEAYLNLNLNKLRADNAAQKAEADFNVAGERLHIFGLDHAALDALREQKENGGFARLEVKAPRSGTITVQNAAQGRLVDATQTLYTIADLSNLWVWCDLYERDLAAVHAQLAKGKTLEAVVRVAAFPDVPFPGSLDLVGSSVDEHTRTLKARVQVANPDGKLRPGMFAHVEIRVPSGGPTAVVPQDAILTDGGTAFVFQQWRDDMWVRRDVELGSSHDGVVEIAGGVADGATIAYGGAFMLKGDILRGKMGAG